ncbi:unnamed protein product [Parajaminaea phylloscopi]
MLDSFRETICGQIIYRASGRKLLRYREERPDFVVPEHFKSGYKEGLEEKKQRKRALGGNPITTPGGDRFFDAHHDERSILGAQTPGGESTGSSHTAASPEESGDRSKALEENRSGADGEKAKQAGKDGAQQEEEKDPYLVDWYGPDDPEHPFNWSLRKKVWVTFNLCFLTFTVYMGSSIVTPGLEQFAMEHGIGLVPASLSISLFVLGYGLGPMILSPLSEIPSVGRNMPYVITLALFVILQVPTAIIHSTAGFFILRFLSGFIGSPPLATGGATIGDMFHAKYRAPWIGVWGMSAVAGPSLGPLVGGFASQALGWRWTIWPILFGTGGTLVLLFFTLPETSQTNILARRAQRLRRLTGNDQLRSKGEKQQSEMTGKDIAMMTIVRPFILTVVEPMVLLLNLLIGLVYAILYAWLEAFPLVFQGAYGFNSGQLGMAFLSLFIGALLTWLGFVVYCKVRLEPLFDRKGGMIDPEDRLEPAFFGLWWLPICLFGFGWTATASVHWIVPMIFASFFSIGTFLAFQSALNFLSDSYPEHVASVLASNDLFRSAMGGVFPLFSRAMFQNLQKSGPTGFPVAWGCVLLGCLTILFIPLPFVFHRYGPKLRSYSRYAS